MNNLVGERFGKLLITSIQKELNKPIKLHCLCDCGTSCIKRRDHILSGSTQSCGCMRSENRGSVTHGMRHTSEYSVWCNMKSRCYNRNKRDFVNYGGRGIIVCDRWLNSFENFFADMGFLPDGHSIDRIDVNGNYEPANCRWASSEIQSQNTRRTKLNIEKASEIKKLRKEGMTFPDLAKKFNVSQGSIGFILAGKQWRNAQ